jgi:hypothetical protein
MLTFLKTLAVGFVFVLAMLVVEIIVTGRMPNLSLWDETALFGAIFGAALLVVVIIAVVAAIHERFSRRRQ